MTNGDEIRRMSDEELWRLFQQVRFGAYGLASEIVNAMEESSLLKWLKTERKENDTPRLYNRT